MMGKCLNNIQRYEDELMHMKQSLEIYKTTSLDSGVARRGKWEHAPWDAGLGAQQHTFCNHFKRVFKQKVRPKDV